MKPVLNAALFCAASATMVRAQQAPANPAGGPPVKGNTTLVTTDAQVPIPLSMALRGSLKADKKTLKVGEAVTFTYTVTNASKKEPQTLRFSSGQRFDMAVQSKSDKNMVWLMSKSRMFTMMLGTLAFAPGETKTFTATWKPAPGELKPGAPYTVSAYLTPMAKKGLGGGPSQTALATLALASAK